MARSSGNAVLRFEARQQDACPGDTVEFPFRSASLSDSSLAWVVTCSEPRFVCVIRGSDEADRAVLIVEVPGEINNGAYGVDVRATDPAGVAMAESRVIVDVSTSIRLVPSSLKWDAGALAGAVVVRNCSPVKPKLNFRVRCEQGRITLTSTVDASIAVPGVSEFSFKLGELPQADLGSCSLELVDQDGVVHDAIDFADQMSGTDRPRRRDGPEDTSRSSSNIVVLVAIVVAIVVAVVVFWPGNGPDPDPAPPPGPEASAVVVLRVATEGRTFTITALNDGDGDLFVDGAAIVGEAEQVFFVSDDQCTDNEVAPGETCRIVVELDPPGEGRFDAELTISSNAVNSPTGISFGTNVIN